MRNSSGRCSGGTRSRWPLPAGLCPTLSRQIYAGADFFLMPSQSEPCGLAQMIALRYGTIPIVRSTGGLADSIIDWDTPGGGCGFTFQSYNADDMLGPCGGPWGCTTANTAPKCCPAPSSAILAGGAAPAVHGHVFGHIK